MMSYVYCQTVTTCVYSSPWQLRYIMAIGVHPMAIIYSAHLAPYRVGLWQDAELEEMLQCFFSILPYYIPVVCQFVICSGERIMIVSFNLFIEQTQQSMKF